MKQDDVEELERLRARVRTLNKKHYVLLRKKQIKRVEWVRHNCELDRAAIKKLNTFIRERRQEIKDYENR